MPNRQNARSQRLRQSIAVEAARIMSTEGQRSYLLAKQKAAERLGVSGGKGLPSNAQIEEELKAWQLLFGQDQHEDRLLELRQAAARAMRFLADFRPRLVGSVAEGTADQYSRISLHLFTEDPDAVVHFLMEQQVRFDQERRRIRWHDGSQRNVDVLVIEKTHATVELVVMVGRDALQAQPGPIDGRPQNRLSLSELNELISQSSSRNQSSPWPDH